MEREDTRRLTLPRPRSTDPRSEQVLLRLTMSELRVLQAVAHLDGSTASGYARGLVVAHLQVVSQDELVKADLANREAYERRAANADIAPLAVKREKGRPADSSSPAAPSKHQPG